MDRRNFLNSIFGGALASVFNSVKSTNSQVEDGAFIIPKKSTSTGLFVITYNELSGSKDFPIRPKNSVLTDGSLLWFVWPSELGSARGYVRPYDASPIENLKLIVHRIRIGRPDPPYYLYWKSGNYYMYKTPGALVKRATYLVNKPDRSEADVLQAISDYRFAVILNLIFKPGLAEEKMAELSAIDEGLRRKINDPNALNFAVLNYQEILTSVRYLNAVV